MFRKYIIVAMPSPMPSPLRRRNAEIPKQMPASSIWIEHEQMTSSYTYGGTKEEPKTDDKPSAEE